MNDIILNDIEYINTLDYISNYNCDCNKIYFCEDISNNKNLNIQIIDSKIINISLNKNNKIIDFYRHEILYYIINWT